MCIELNTEKIYATYLRDFVLNFIFIKYITFNYYGNETFL